MRRKDFLWFVAPSALVMTVLLIVPLIQTITWSLQDVSYGTPGTFTGLTNYVDALTDTRFHSSVFFTVIFTLVSTVLKILIGYALALLLQLTTRTRPIFLAFILVSYVVPTVIGATSFSWLFDSNFGGLVNFFLEKFGSDGFLWFSEKWPDRFMLMLNVIWHEVPFAVLILLAGLQGVPKEPLEASSIDGASWWQRQRFIIIPALKPLFGFIALVSIMDGLRIFDPLIPLAPNAVGLGGESIMLYVYNTAFREGDQNLGLGSAVSILTMILILILLTPFIRQTYREVRQK